MPNVDLVSNTFYHTSPILLEKDSIIKAGNFGRIIKKIGASHNLYAREMILDWMRIKDFPNKPSRLHSAFSCLTLDEVRFLEIKCLKI